MLTNTTAVCLAAEAKSCLDGLAKQIISGAIYVGPAVVLPFLINQFRGKDSFGQSSE